MAITIEVYRGAGDRPGDEIREALLNHSRAAAVARGRAELDAHAHQRLSTTLNLVAPRLELMLGNLIEVNDAAQGTPWRGKIVGIKHSCAAGEVPTVLTVERATDV